MNKCPTAGESVECPAFGLHQDDSCGWVETHPPPPSFSHQNRWKFWMIIPKTCSLFNVFQVIHSHVAPVPGSARPGAQDPQDPQDLPGPRTRCSSASPRGTSAWRPTQRWKCSPLPKRAHDMPLQTSHLVLFTNLGKKWEKLPIDR